MNTLEDSMTNSNPEYGLKGIRQASDKTLRTALSIDTERNADSLDFLIRKTLNDFLRHIPNDDTEESRKLLADMFAEFVSCVTFGLSMAPKSLTVNDIRVMGFNSSEHIDVERKNMALTQLRFKILKDHINERMSSEFSIQFKLEDESVEAILLNYEDIIGGLDVYIKMVNSISEFSNQRERRQAAPDLDARVNAVLAYKEAGIEVTEG